jgi:hypothetical protein
MSYADTAALVANYGFQTRVIAASTEQALIFVNDTRPEFNGPAEHIILSASNALPFVNLVAGQPGMTEASTDGDILAALQAVWPKYGAALTP